MSIFWADPWLKEANRSRITRLWVTIQSDGQEELRLTFIGWLEAGFLPTVKASTKFDLGDGAFTEISDATRGDSSRRACSTRCLCSHCATISGHSGWNPRRHSLTYVIYNRYSSKILINVRYDSINTGSKNAWWTTYGGNAKHCIENIGLNACLGGSGSGSLSSVCAKVFRSLVSLTGVS